MVFGLARQARACLRLRVISPRRSAHGVVVIPACQLRLVGRRRRGRRAKSRNTSAYRRSGLPRSGSRVRVKHLQIARGSGARGGGLGGKARRARLVGEEAPLLVSRPRGDPMRQAAADRAAALRRRPGRVHASRRARRGHRGAAVTGGVRGGHRILTSRSIHPRHAAHSFLPSCLPSTLRYRKVTSGAFMSKGRPQCVLLSFVGPLPVKRARRATSPADGSARGSRHLPEGEGARRRTRPRGG
jgi:hypothetical protein